MEISKINSFIPVEKQKQTAEKTGNTVNDIPQLTGDKASVAAKAAGIVPATSAIFGSADNAPGKLTLTTEEISADLEKFGASTYAEKFEMKNLKIDKDGNATYRIEGSVQDYESEGDNQVWIDYNSSEWKAKVENGKLVDRQPLHDIKAVSGGELTDGLNMYKVRFGKQADGTERLVFDIKRGRTDDEMMPLEESDTVGMYNVFQSINPDGTATINVELNGYRTVDGFSSLDKIKGSENDLINNVVSGPVAVMDDSATAYRINLKKPVQFEVKALTGEGPARLVIDIKGSK